MVPHQLINRVRRFFEIFVNTPLDVCEARDVKGLYKKAREGSIAGFTGVSQDYEEPQAPDLIVTTENLSVQESTNRVIDLLEMENIIPKNLRNIEVVRIATKSNQKKTTPN